MTAGAAYMPQAVTVEWETPQALFDRLDAEFHFTLDVCATPENAKCERYFTPTDDGLAQAWTGACWMNPPYGRAIAAWMQKAYRESVLHGATVVCLVPARTDTRWWHEAADRGVEVRFIKGRVKFGGAPFNAPFPSAIVIFRPFADEAIPPTQEPLAPAGASKPNAATPTERAGK